MIAIEYVNAQIQEGTTSHAIKSRRPGNHNPAIDINLVHGNFIWELTGLRLGIVQQIPGRPRRNHVDFYIGLDDLVAQRHLFPPTTARVIGGSTRDVRDPTDFVREGGKEIAWKRPISRVPIEDLIMSMPPLRVTTDPDEELILNVDLEYSRYTINNGNGETTHEIHFGFQNPFIVRQNRVIKIPRIVAVMTPEQYATALEAIDIAIGIHTI